MATAKFRSKLACYSLLALSALLGACQTTPPPHPVVEPQAAAPPQPADPLPSHIFKINDGDDVIGEVQVTRSTKEDTLSDIARRFNLGYEELVRANPGVDPWLPGEGTAIVLPTQFVLPDAPREGIVVNLAELRLFYFPKRQPGEPQTVITHPIGIGKVGWVTPEGTTKVISKRKNPIWTPPASVRKEHAEHGDPLPKVVPAGADNPLGAFAMNMGWSGYLIHGTNKPYGVGMRSSHGCLRLYPEDIALLFGEVAIGTSVHVVNQQMVSGWHEGNLYVQVMPPPEEQGSAEEAAQKLTKSQQAKIAASKTTAAVNSSDRLAQQATRYAAMVDQTLVAQLKQQHTGVATPVSSGATQAQYIAKSRYVENRVPDGATWNGNKELLVTAEEFEAMRNGVILPKKEVDKKEASKASSKKTT